MLNPAIWGAIHSTLLWALAGKSELYYSDKKSEGRIKQVGEENR